MTGMEKLKVKTLSIKEDQLDLFPDELVPCVVCGNTPDLVHTRIGWGTTDRCSRMYSYNKKSDTVRAWNYNNQVD